MEACVGSPWGAIADDIQDAPTCVRGCRDSLRRLLAPNDETYENFCRMLVQLDQPKRDDMLLGLYCCDSQLCGVDNIGLPGYDREQKQPVPIFIAFYGFRVVDNRKDDNRKHDIGHTFIEQHDADKHCHDEYQRDRSRITTHNIFGGPESIGEYFCSQTSQLVSPSPSYLGADGVPLTPPPRLQDRRLLPTGSSEQLIDRAHSRLRQGFHLPTTSRNGLGSPYGSTIGPPAAMSAAAAGALAMDRQSSAPSSPNPARGPFLSPTRSQFASISYASSLADPGPPPNRDLPSTPVRAALAQSMSRSRASVSPNAIGVAIDFPPTNSDLSTQVSNESGSSESKIMTGPMAGDTWRDDWVTTDDEEPAPLASQRLPTRGAGHSPVMERQSTSREAG
ncbi:hypothetical protein PWT90_04415 [Aphanocladium album]|nr:hypothetical protein PWT90_04415 [Aphanocladium album]